jgi:hypothetical protein
VFCAIAAAVEDEKDLAFAANFVQALNLLLLTAPEVTSLPPLPPFLVNLSSFPPSHTHTTPSVAYDTALQEMVSRSRWRWLSMMH